MKRLFASLAFAAVVFGLAGCGHVDLSPEGDPNRVVTGTVAVRMDLLPPPDAEVVVRVVEPPDVKTAEAKAANDIVIGERGTLERPERVIGEQVIHAPSSLPVSFRIEFHADDVTMRRGLNLEARISWGHRVRFRNLESQAITLATVGQPQIIRLEPVR